MIDYDLHIHTEYCGHAAEMAIDKIIARADEAELKTIAIASHTFGERDLPLVHLIREEADAIKSDCRVIVGAEVDVDGSRYDGKLVTDKLDDIEYVVAGFHYVPGPGNYPHSPADCPLQPQEMFARWQSTLLGVVSNARIDTLAHPGRMIASAVDLDVYFEDALCVFAQAAKLSAQNEIAWEINELNGTKLAPYYREQWHRIYEIAIEAGVKLVYGSDSHFLSSIGQTYFTESILAKLPDGCLSTPQSLGII